MKESKKERKREKRIVLNEHPVIVGDSGKVVVEFTAHHSGKLQLVFVYEDEINLFDINEFTFV